MCSVVEDAKHALFLCKAHEWIRFQHRKILEVYNEVTDILNPKTVEDADKIGRYIKEIEDNMVKLNMAK